MAISTSISRLADYYTRYGLGATIRRGTLAMRRLVSSNRAVVFYWDLSGQTLPPADFPSSLKVERLRTYAELSPQDLDQLVHIWNPKLAHHRIKERFDQGASLWLIKFRDRLAGYGWTLQGRAIAPYYFPLAEDDVQFFDFHVFSKYRGRAIDWCLMTHILQSVAAGGAARAFAEAGEWNQASLASIGMTSFRRLGWARKLTVFGHTIVWWGENETIGQERTDTPRRSSTSARLEKVPSSRSKANGL
jgi:hypothetical protein